ncbi:hypothetical protein ES703_115329 [subsurface metagenome]
MAKKGNQTDTKLLMIENLQVEVEGREILHHVDLEINLGQTNVLFGQNGRGQTNLLMAPGLGEEEGTVKIVRGFLHVEIEGLPPELKAEMDRAVEISEKSLL